MTRSVYARAFASRGWPRERLHIAKIGAGEVLSLGGGWWLALEGDRDEAIAEFLFAAHGERAPRGWSIEWSGGPVVGLLTMEQLFPEPAGWSEFWRERAVKESGET